MRIGILGSGLMGAKLGTMGDEGPELAYRFERFA